MIGPAAGDGGVLAGLDLRVVGLVALLVAVAIGAVVWFRRCFYIGRLR